MPLAAGNNIQNFSPLYQEVKRLITESLIGGEWKAAAALPSETRLAQRFKVSIGTVRKAIDELVAEHILVRQQGRGTFVAQHDERRLLFNFFHIVGTVRKAIDELVAEHILVRQQGRGTFVAQHDERRLLFNFFHIVGKDGVKTYPTVATLSFRRAAMSAVEAAKLHINPANAKSNTRSLRIRNLLSLDGKPVVLDDIVIAESMFPTLTVDIFRKRDNTIYQLYQTGYGINVVRTAERLSVTTADEDSGRALGVAAGTPLLQINRIAYTYHSLPVELRRSLVNTSEHEYFSDLDRPVK